MKQALFARSILLATLAFAASASAQIYPCTGNGAGCRDPIPDPSSEGYSAALTSTITLPPGVCSAANPLGTVGISFRILHDDVRDLGAIAVTSPTGVSIPLAPALSGGEDYDHTAPCGTAVVSGSPYWDYFPASAGTIVYSTAVSGTSTASGTWTMQLLDTRHGAYGALDGWSLDVSCGIPGVTLTTVNAIAIEGYGAPAVVTVSRSPVTTHPVRIWLTVGGTATSGADYAGVTFPIELCGGVASRDLSFAAILDALAEGSETVTLSLAANAGYASAGSTAATLTLLDQIIPTFTTPPATTFTIGTAGVFNVGTVAVPAAGLAWSGALPAGVSVTVHGDGTATIAGTPAPGTAGTYALSFNATRPIPPEVAQAFTLNVVKVAQTVTFAQPADAAFASGPVAVDASASSGLPVSFTSQTPSVCTVAGSSVTLLAVGTCTIAADQAGDDTWAVAPTVLRSFGVGKAANVITFAQPSDVMFGSGPVMLAASASSGLTVSFTSQTASVCTVAGTSVALLGAGTCTVAADEPGDSTWAAATAVVRSFAVLPVTMFTGPVFSGSGLGTVTFTGGGPTCTFILAAFKGLPAPTPDGFDFTEGAFAFGVSGCAPGTVVDFTIAYPVPLQAGTVLFGFAGGSWSTVPSAIQGAKIAFAITAGGDGMASGEVAPASAVFLIPTLNVWMMILLAVFLAVAALRTMR